jgi:hypothetical protein
MIYNAANDAHGWGAEDFHMYCDGMGWTLTIVETTKGFIFGGFTTAEWESHQEGIFKSCPQSFLFSVNEGRKYPILFGGTEAIICHSGCCAAFGTGGNELMIYSHSNSHNDSYFYGNGASFNLPKAKGSKHPSMNGGENKFQLKQFEVYSVSVRISINIIFRINERRDRVRLICFHLYF